MAGISREGPVLATVQGVAGRLIVFREGLSPGEQAVLDSLLTLAAREHAEVDGYGLNFAGTPLETLARAVGLSAVALAIALSVNVAPAAAAPGGGAANNGIVTLTAAPRGQVDLIIKSAVITAAGDGFARIRYTVANQGSRDAAPFHVGVLGGADRLAEYAHPIGLRAGTEYTADYRVPIGAHTDLSVVADSRGVVMEQSDRNNGFAVHVPAFKAPVQVAPPPQTPPPPLTPPPLLKPIGGSNPAVVTGSDLVIEQLSQGPWPNDDVMVLFTVKHTGPVKLRGFRVSVLDADHRELRRFTELFDSGSGPQSKDVVTSVLPGDSRRLQVVVEPLDGAPDTNVTNNSAWVTLYR